ncbi:MAG: hypothetical protein H7258_09905 [Ferruginibacter sp.]|nr:hypothetical protein [Ferruginibacter sp.]
MMLEKKKKPEKTAATQKTAISILSVTIIVFFYFAIMILLSKLKYDTGLAAVLKEMLTIPALAILGISFIISLVHFIKTNFMINSLAFYALIIQLVTVGLIVYIA